VFNSSAAAAKSSGATVPSASKRLTRVGNFDLYDCILSNWTDAPGNAFNKSCILRF
jgi:hypothetical protein